jgi:hypothetical protein
MDPRTAPIIVVGTGRSGTTLLRRMLCAHPRIYVTHEPSFYVWESLWGRRGPRDRTYLDYYFASSNYRWLRLAPARVLRDLPDPLPPARIGEAYAAVMREKAAQYGRVRYGEKTPSHAFHLPRLFEDFPDARVVHIVRDPRGTSLSLSQMPWACASVTANAAFCELERRSVAKFEKRMLRVKLEDLLSDARTTMGRVLDFVGEPWDDAVLDHARNAPNHDDMPPLPWLEGAAKERGAPRARWEKMPGVQIRAVERVARGLMKEMGYSPAELAEEPSSLAVLWARLRELPETARHLGVYWRMSRLLRDAENFDTPEVLRLFARVNPEAWSHYPGFELPLPPPLPV